jgi:V/A-type H+/Na+-transporting ATPase subunit E
MSLENIVSKILDDARLQAEQIGKKTQESISLIINEARERADALSSEIIKSMKKSVALENKRFEISQAIEYKKAVLNKRQELIEEVFKKAHEQLSNSKETEYLSLVKTILLGSIERGDEVVAISEKDKDRITDKFLNTVNEAFASAGRAGKLRVRTDKDLKENSIILETSDTRTDVSFGVVLVILKSELLTNVAKILFTEK